MLLFILLDVLPQLIRQDFCIFTNEDLKKPYRYRLKHIVDLLSAHPSCKVQD